MLTIVTPAANRDLLSIEEMRSAVGIASGDTSRDADLRMIGAGIFDRISAECSVAGDGVTPATLKRETVAQTIRSDRAAAVLILARRFVGQVISITFDGTAVDPSAYEVEAGAGLVYRLCDGRRIDWAPGTAIVTYQAGFSEIPGDLVLAARAALREQWSGDERDPLMKRDKVEGLGEQEFWVGGLGSAGTGSAFSATVRAMLDPYRSVV